MLSLSANASISSKDNYYTSLCIDDDATGYSWKNGDWSRTNFIPAKYIVKKFPYSKSSLCDINKAAYKDKRTYGCYALKSFGEEFNMLSYELCNEYWTDGALFKVRCNTSVFGHIIEFQPNGVFRMSKTDRGLNYSKLKDDMFVSHGKCSTM